MTPHGPAPGPEDRPAPDTMAAAGAAPAVAAAEAATEAVRLREARDREGLLVLAARHPRDPAVAYQTAWLHDTLGHESAAVPYYEAALAAEGLPPRDRLGAHTGLGSTYRVLGRYDDALAAFDRALAEHPADPALTAFRALTLHNLGRSSEAVGELLHLLTRTSGDPSIAAYRRALDHYADHPDETTPADA